MSAPNSIELVDVASMVAAKLTEQWRILSEKLQETEGQMRLYGVPIPGNNRTLVEAEEKATTGMVREALPHLEEITTKTVSEWIANSYPDVNCSTVRGILSRLAESEEIITTTQGAGSAPSVYALKDSGPSLPGVDVEPRKMLSMKDAVMDVISRRTHAMAVGRIRELVSAEFPYLAEMANKSTLNVAVMILRKNGKIASIADDRTGEMLYKKAQAAE